MRKAPVSNTNDLETGNEKIIQLKNELGKMRKRAQPIVIRYHKVSVLKDPELHYMTLLQLYMPWTDENDLISGCTSYAQKFGLVKDDIMCNIRKHDACYGRFDLDEDLLFEQCDSDDDACDDSDEEPSDFGMLNPSLLDLNNSDGSNNPTMGPVASSSVDDESLPPSVFYDMCSQLNEGQQLLFNFIMKYAQQLQLNERNDISLLRGDQDLSKEE